MPRRPRLLIDGVPLHIIQRGNNRHACFDADGDYWFYLEWLEEYAKKHGCAVHAYTLMTNHVHLLLSAKTPDSPAVLMKALGQRYVQYINRQYRRSGTLWEGRYRSCLIQQDAYLMGCQRYIELNPVRAGMVEHPGEYRWSSYRANAQGEPNTLLTSHLLYAQLGVDAQERQQAYPELFRYELIPVWWMPFAARPMAITHSAIRSSPSRSNKHWVGVPSVAKQAVRASSLCQIQVDCLNRRISWSVPYYFQLHRVCPHPQCSGHNRSTTCAGFP